MKLKPFVARIGVKIEFSKTENRFTQDLTIKIYEPISRHGGRTGAREKLTVPQLQELAGEIRHRADRGPGQGGGHLGPNLGVVELTIALHRVFNTPKDKFVWDVSHQVYVHKMLTGRKTVSAPSARRAA
jgi:hypothetical protein